MPPAEADQGCTGPRRILSRTTRPCLSSSRAARNARETSRSAPLSCAQRRWLPPRLLPGRCVVGLLWPGLVAPGPGRRTGGLATGGRGRWTGGLTTGRWTKPGWRQPCQPAPPPQPNPRRQAKPHWYQPGPRQAELYQQYLRPPQTNCAFSTGEASASEAGGANAPTPSAASAGTVSWEINPAMARDRASLRNMCRFSERPSPDCGRAA